MQKISILLLFLSIALHSNDRLKIRNKVVIDRWSGLMWQKSSSKGGNWHNAVKYCKNLNLAGYKDWRLPNIDELMSIVDKNSYSPAINRRAFPDTKSDYYWSYSSKQKDSSKAWLVFFHYGYDYYYYKDNIGYSRCVRVIEE